MEMEKNGWIKIHRKMLDNPVVFKDADHLAVWMYLLLEATHQDYPKMFGGKKIVLKPGQLITGRKVISEKTGVNESKVKRILNVFKSEQQIDQQAERYGSIITILSWDKYQCNDQQNDQQVTNEWPTSDQQVTTLQEHKNRRTQEQKKDIYSSERIEIINCLNDAIGSNYKPNTKKTKDLIHARLSEGFTVDDFKTVIYKKTKQWMNDPKMCKFLRPETLFSNKFEGYLNEKEALTFAERLAMA